MKKLISVTLAVLIVASNLLMAFAKTPEKGDANGDGKITAVDAREILLVVVALKEITETEKALYDTDGNGIITATDARKVLMIVAGLEEAPTEEPSAEESTTEDPSADETTTAAPEEPSTEETTTAIPEEPTTETFSDEEKMIKIIEDEFIRLVNEERASKGVGKLTVNETLYKGAKIRAAECLDLFDHTRPNGEQYYTVLQGDLAYNYSIVGENIAWVYEYVSSPNWTLSHNEVDMKNYALQFFVMFKNSSVHYKNMLTAEFKETGFGVAIVVDEENVMSIACSHLFGTQM